MDQADASEERLRRLRDAGQRIDARDLRWQRAGLAAGAAVLLLIAYGTLTPVAAPSSQPPGLDKVVHFLAFAMLIFPVILTDSRRWPWAVPLAILIGGAIELIQPSVGRSAEWLDWGADISGVLAGAALAELLHDRLRPRLIGLVAARPAPDDVALSELKRAELIEDMRSVLREELAAIQRPGEGESGRLTSPPAPRLGDPTDLRH